MTDKEFHVIMCKYSNRQTQARFVLHTYIQLIVILNLQIDRCNNEITLDLCMRKPLAMNYTGSNDIGAI